MTPIPGRGLSVVRWRSPEVTRLITRTNIYNNNNCRASLPSQRNENAESENVSIVNENTEIGTRNIGENSENESASNSNNNTHKQLNNSNNSNSSQVSL